MLRIHFLLRQPNTKGVKAIYATVRYSNQTVILYPGMSIHTDLWLRKKGINKPKDVPENNDLKDKLSDFERIVRRTHMELQAQAPNSIVSPKLLKTAVYAKHLNKIVEESVTPQKENRILIADFFQTLIDDSKNKERLSQDGRLITAATIRSYETTKMHFENFQTKQHRKYRLEDTSQKLIDAFSNYLTYDKKISFNSVGKYMKTMRTLLNYARHKKLITSEILADVKIKVNHEEVDNIYLSMQDIKDLTELKGFETPVHDTVRDLFVIGCLTGLRFSDYSKLNTARFEDGFIHITQLKTHGRITIPIHPIVRKVLDKHPNGLPKAPNNADFNSCLKDIGKKLPQLSTEFEKITTREGKPVPVKHKKWELLQTHTARRSFCTNEYLNGTPTITIMAISGHKTEQSFLTYIKADALQHAMIMKERWLKNDNEDV